MQLVAGLSIRNTAAFGYFDDSGGSRKKSRNSCSEMKLPVCGTISPAGLALDPCSATARHATWESRGTSDLPMLLARMFGYC
jgi:hypothetical protein